MLRRASFFLLFALAAFSLAAVEETLDGLKSRLASAAPDDRPDVCIRIAQFQLRAADKLYKDNHFDEARAAIDDVVTYAEQARDALVQNPRHIKNIEIDTRKMSERLTDIKRTLSVEDQPPLDDAVRRLEQIRTLLLKEMFAKKEKK